MQFDHHHYAQAKSGADQAQLGISTGARAMAWKHVLLVRELAAEAVSHVARLVLYALAARADDDGVCYPSGAQIAADTGLHRATAAKGVKECEAQGYVKVVSGYKSRIRNKYLICVHNFGHMSLSATCHVAESDKTCSGEQHVHVAESDITCSGERQGRIQEDNIIISKPPKRGIANKGTVHNSQNERRLGGAAAAGGDGDSGLLSEVVSGGDSAGQVAQVQAPANERGRVAPVQAPANGRAPAASAYGQAAADRPWNLVGWKPAAIDRERVIQAAFEYGLTSDEAINFWRFNAIRHWTRVSTKYGVSVADLIRSWADKWSRENGGVNMRARELARRRREG